MNSTITSAAIHPILSVLKEQGIETEDLFNLDGLEPEKKALASGRLSVDQFDTWVNQAVRLSQDLTLGTKAGKRLGLSNLYLLGVFISNCKTGREVLNMLRQYYALITDDKTPDFFIGKNSVKIVFYIIPGSSIGQQVRAEFITSAINNIGNLLGESIFRLEEIGLQSHPSNFQYLQDEYNVPIKFGQTQHWVTFSSRYLDAPLTEANPNLFNTLSQHIEDDSPYFQSLKPVGRQVLLLLNHWPSFTPMAKPSVARLLNTSSRTLTRRLTEEQTPFSDLVQMARFSKAEKALQDKHCNLQELALSLGFSDRRGFERAFKLHTGITPAVYRKQHQQSPTD